MYKPAVEYECWTFSPNNIVPSSRFHSYVALFALPLENPPIPVKSIVWSRSTSIDPSILTPGLESIAAVTSWHGSKQLIVASHPLACAAPLLKNWMVKHPLGLSATIKPGLEDALVPENIPNSSADVLSPLYIIKPSPFPFCTGCVVNDWKSNSITCASFSGQIVIVKSSFAPYTPEGPPES